MKKPYWTTKDGRKIRIDRLTDDHLINILKMLKRQAECTQFHIGMSLCLGPQPNGDGAQMAFEMELDHLADQDWRDFARPSFKPLEKEAERRELEWEC